MNTSSMLAEKDISTAATYSLHSSHKEQSAYANPTNVDFLGIGCRGNYAMVARLSFLEELLMEDLRVLVTHKKHLRFWTAYYVDPLSGKQVARSTKATNRKDAERFAGIWEAELRSGKYKAPSKITWEEFTERFEREHCSGLAEKSQKAYRGAFASLERIISPKRLRDVTANVLADFQAKLREASLSEATIASYLRHVKASLKWAEDIGLIPEAPKIKMPKRVKGQSMMKGRPITGEEFDRMIEKTKDVCGKGASSYERLLRGLWLSGLRIGEAVEISWDSQDGLVICLDGKRPMMKIPADAEKGFKDRLLPITPDFAEFLYTVPEADQTGRVFPLLNKAGKPMVCPYGIGKRITDIGTKAGIKVKDEAGKTKFASAHDLRRAFGLRWAKRVMPAVLQALMRHESIQTTMKYYVGQQAESIADVIWNAARMDTSLDSSPNSESGSAKEKPQAVVS